MAQVIVDRNVDVKMRDGVLLRADVYRPAVGGQYPVLLHRLPYNKSLASLAAALMLNPLVGVERGYIVVIQDCRGRFASEGEWIPFHVEGNDGFDTVEWCAGQPWSNGRVGIYGSSYMGVTTWQTITAAPPHLEAAFVRLTGTNYHDGWVYSGGAFELGFNLRYALGQAWDTLSRLPSDRQKYVKIRMIETALDLWSAFRRIPIKDIDVFKEVAPYYYEWLSHPSYDEYWRAVNVEERYDQIKVPVLQMTGWFDNFLLGHLRSFQDIANGAATETARKNQKLIIGPWTHGNYLGRTPSKVGDIEFGPAVIPDAEGLTLRWFDYWLKGIDNGIMREPPVRIFVMGANVWRDEEAWPPKRTRETNWCLHSKGHANTLNGDGALSLQVCADEPPDSYVYDPANPVPSVGGRTLMPEIGTDGFQDQRSVEGRSDVLVYTSSPLAKDVEVTGPILVKLWAASTACDTDFTAKLVDVYPEGYAANVSEGILRARYRDSIAEPKLLEPGHIYELSIDLWATSQVFKKGHRIRVEVSSSNFPRFDRNLNTGRDNAGEALMQTAIQTIYHDTEHPSHIILHMCDSWLQNSVPGQTGSGM